MARKRYDANVIQLADSKLKDLMMQGSTYHMAAKKVAQELGIDFAYLRYRAFYMNDREKYYEHTHTQHRIDTEHGQLLVACKTRLENEGYLVISEQTEIRNFMKRHGSAGNPDLVAVKFAGSAEQGFKHDHTLLVEVVENEKKYETIMHQIKRYRKVGKVVIVLPTDTSNIELWGKQNLV